MCETCSSVCRLDGGEVGGGKAQEQAGGVSVLVRLFKVDRSDFFFEKKAKL